MSSASRSGTGRKRGWRAEAEGLPSGARGGNIRVLISNHALADRGGSELFVRDIAIRLKRRGHHPVAYSTVPGPIADELRAAGVPTIEDLRLLKDAPDVIHGQHHIDAAAAALRFPGTPAIHACHGWAPWQESPLLLASIRRYVAVSDLTREYFVTSGAPPDRVTVIPNFVDLERFATMRDPARSVRRAVVYGNGWTPGAPALAAIRAACERMGVEVEAIGTNLGRSVERPEDILPGFDVVFGLGRSALEAMACGCAVVLAGPAGFGGLVTSETLSRMRAANFGFGAIAGRKATVEAVTGALELYDADDVARVAQRVRSEAGIETAIDQWDAQYRLAIAEGPAPLDEVVASASAYLVKLKGLTSQFEHGWYRLMHEQNLLNASIAGERSAFSAERDRIETQRAAERSEARALEAALEAQCAELSSEADRLRSALTSVKGELAWLRAKPRGLKRILAKMGLRR